MSDYSALAHELFHAFDIRIDSSLLTDEVEERLAKAQGWYFREVLKTDSIVLSRDARLSSPRIMQKAADTFRSLGFRVHMCITPATTCRFYWSTAEREGSAGIMFTASHNPGYYTGQKMIGPGCFPIAEGFGEGGGIAAVKEAFIEGKSPEKGNGKITVFNDLIPYVDFFMKLSGTADGSLRGVRIMADFLSGAAGEEVILAMQKAGAELDAENAVPDGHFPEGAPNPILTENVERMERKLLGAGRKYDFAVSFDGDGDRMDTLTGNAVRVPPSLLFSFISPRLAKGLGYGGTPIVGLDSKASPLAHIETEKAGARPFLIPNGHSLIKGLLLEYGLMGAAEETAHYYLRLKHGKSWIPMESTLFILLSFLNAWKEDPEGLRALLAKQSAIYTENEWSRNYESEEERAGVLDSIEAFFTEKGYRAVKTLENGEPLGSVLLKKSWDDGSSWCWISERASQSEKGLARWMINSSDRTEMENAKKEIDRLATGGRSK